MLKKHGLHYFNAGALLVQWSNSIRFLESFSILRTLALLKMGNLR